MSKTKTKYCLSKEFTTKAELTALIQRISTVIATFNACHNKLREHTRFHILDNINSFLIVISSEISWSCIK